MLKAVTEETSGEPAGLAGADDDATLVRRFQAGDVDAFTSLYQRHSPAVRDVCRNRLRDPAMVEDAVQETFVRAFAALPRFTHGARVGNWLKRVAANHCMDLLRRHENRNVPLEDAAAETIIDRASELELTRSVHRQAITGILRELSRRDAEVLLDHHLGDEPVALLAERWGQTVGAMKVTLHRARRRFRDLSAGVLGIGPFGLLRRWWRQSAFGLRQADGSLVSASAMVPAATLQVLVAVTLSASPAVADTLDRLASAGTNHAEVTVVAPAAARDDGQARPERAARHLDRSHGRRERRTNADPAEVSSPPPVRVESVHVPVANKRIQQSPTGEPDYRYGVDVGPAEPIWIEKDKDSDATTVHEVGCTVAEAMPAVTYCDRGASDSGVSPRRP